MKQILFFTLLVLFGLSLQAQETTCDYVPYQDGLFVLRCVTVEDTGFPGLQNVDTTYQVPPVDSFTLQQQIAIRAANNSNGYVNRFRNNGGFRRLFNEANAFDALLGQVGGDYHQEMVERFGNRIVGQYTLETPDSNHVVNIINHPNLSNRLRAENPDTGERWNIRIWSRDFIEVINYEDTDYYLALDPENNARRKFREWAYFIPRRLIDRDVQITLTETNQ